MAKTNNSFPPHPPLSADKHHIKVTPPPVGNYQDLHVHLRKVAAQTQGWSAVISCPNSLFPHFPSLSLSCCRCHCPPQFDGPDCQQTRLSFLGNGYAWLPPIRPCFDSHLSLEFMTDKDDGLLLYAGPLATLLPGDTEDYVAIGNCFLPLLCLGGSSQIFVNDNVIVNNLIEQKFRLLITKEMRICDNY